MHDLHQPNKQFQNLIGRGLFSNLVENIYGPHRLSITLKPYELVAWLLP